MECIEIDAKDLEEWTSLEETVQCSQDKDRFLQLKSQHIGEIDRKAQLKVFDHLRELMRKAVGVEGDRFEADDFERLEGYRHASLMIGNFPIEQINSGSQVNIGFGSVQQYGQPRPLMDVLNVIRQTTGKIPIPVMIRRSKSGEIESVDLSNLDIEINRRLFNHVYNVLTGQEQVQFCDECGKLFVPRRQGKPQLYCSPVCRSRVSSREYERKKRSKS